MTQDQSVAMDRQFGETEMPFILEKIDTPERRQERDSLRLTSPLTGLPLDVTRWFVDRERGLYFIVFGGGGPEIPFIFGLADGQGLLLEAHARKESVGEFHKKDIELTWNVSEVRIPKNHALHAETLIVRLRDALADYGLLGDTTVTKSVSVETPAPKFV